MKKKKSIVTSVGATTSFLVGGQPKRKIKGITMPKEVAGKYFKYRSAIGDRIMVMRATGRGGPCHLQNLCTSYWPKGDFAGAGPCDGRTVKGIIIYSEADNIKELDTINAWCGLDPSRFTILKEKYVWKLIRERLRRLQCKTTNSKTQQSQSKLK